MIDAKLVRMGQDYFRRSCDPARTLVHSACRGVENRVCISYAAVLLAEVEAGVTICCAQSCILLVDVGMLPSSFGRI
jgi:hypothetical protein